jgi:hypothetical protein
MFGLLVRGAALDGPMNLSDLQYALVFQRSVGKKLPPPALTKEQPSIDSEIEGAA